jgi:double-strand break repair protein MRE11
LLFQDNLSAIDILSASNLVNYFGKMALDGSGTGQIKLRPVLLRKVGRNEVR